MTAYGFWTEERVRFADLDLLGHVNNKAFMTYAESGRVAFLQATGLWQRDAQRQNVVARIELDYLRELHYPNALRIGVRVLRIGRSAFTLGLGMFANGSCVATAVTVLVRIDMHTRRAVALDEDEIARLRPYLAAAP
ncbi:acyl-CoA thioester hydrolase [Fontimonas thermophila]|uniref:Acyl-CoA thioester hydrolase n=2 Tax=Fontimonas thermophila TaxID=1076937 RepID=A0A1I2JWG5_9GAMM|nr:acyl-CoA thioester hydrolase [Fontimonas thermophila]